MKVVTDMWLAPSLPGYDEVRNFYTKMAQKLAFAPGMGGMGGYDGPSGRHDEGHERDVQGGFEAGGRTQFCKSFGWPAWRTG